MFMEAPRSHMAFLMCKVSILHEMTNIHEFLYLGGNFLCIMAETFSSTLTISFQLNFCLLVYSSFRNSTYRGTCLIASNKGMFTLTLCKVSKIFLFSFSFLVLANLYGKGELVMTMSAGQNLILFGGYCHQLQPQVLCPRLLALYLSVSLAQGLRDKDLPKLLYHSIV